MDIKVTKDEKEYVFKYSTQQIDAGRNKAKPITFHKWTLEGSDPQNPVEVFYGVDHSDAKAKSGDDLLKQAEKDAYKLI